MLGDYRLSPAEVGRSLYFRWWQEGLVSEAYYNWYVQRNCSDTPIVTREIMAAIKPPLNAKQPERVLEEWM